MEAPQNRSPELRAAEFFAGAGLVRRALEPNGFQVVFANDIDPTKKLIYEANHGASDFVLGDVADVSGGDVPDIDLATASFPCTDLSLAGGRAGLAGNQSGLIRQFFRVLREMGERRPQTVMLENVPGLATSNGGKDFRAVISGLNELGYECDVLAIDAKRFVPQSRLRLFVVGSSRPRELWGDWAPPDIRPPWVRDLAVANRDLDLKPAILSRPPENFPSLGEVVERFGPKDGVWWDSARQEAFLASLSPLQAERLAARRKASRLNWSTAYRRTRAGKPVWEIRSDEIAGCLRTTRGGSSKQAVVEAGKGGVRVRWMTAREYARLQGAGEMSFGDATDSQARFALGDAVCVPVVSWLAANYLRPLAIGG